MIIKNWLKTLLPYICTYLAINFILRIILAFEYSKTSYSVIEFFKIIVSGLVFDLKSLGYFCIIVIILRCFFRQNSKKQNLYLALNISIFAIFYYIWLFGAVSEFFFWQEFASRFNFIAVDYLIYTTEVINNIKESYPLYSILGVIAFITILTIISQKKQFCLIQNNVQTSQMRFVGVGLIVMILLFANFFPDKVLPNFNGNQEAEELAKNGTYALFSAYHNNELDYKGFYIVKPEKEINENIRKIFASKNSQFISQDINDITRIIRKTGQENHKNVIMVVMESMGDNFMALFGNKDNLTPNLDKLAGEGFFFSNMYATGTRTVRGLEALSLSIPPTPGQSIVRRKDNGNLFTIGSVFADRSYDTAFIYGGYGYFDNMNAYYAANNFRIVDRANFKKDEVKFSNAWGVSDEDLFKKTIKEADINAQNNKKFFYMVMTTSNHRPYTFPKNDAGIPEKNGGRSAGVKYADFAIGKLLDEAKNKKWFKDTVFIFVADHTAGAGGKTELSVEKYHIPAIIYAPDFIKPKHYDLISSQIDLPPTLFGILNFSYVSKFFGKDVINEQDSIKNQPYAFISNYQKIGLLRDGVLSVLKPKRLSEQYKDDILLPKESEDKQLTFDNISFYQHASDWRKVIKYVNSVP